MHGPYHTFIHWLAGVLGQTISEQTPTWLHPLLHLTLFWGPALMLCVLVLFGARLAWKRFKVPREKAVVYSPPVAPGFAKGILRFIYVNSKKDQIALACLGILAMPILYLSLELPKIIINDAIESGHFPITSFGLVLDQERFLFAASALFLVVISLHGGLKFLINVYKGRVGERLLRRTRLLVYRAWSRGAGGEKRTEVIPIIVQEVEPIGGFASEAFSLPVFQGGTFITIVTFMFVQDPILGMAALGLLPIQLAVIPRLQRKINQLARQRMIKVRSLSGTLGDQANQLGPNGSELRSVGGKLREIERIRRRIHRVKFFMKALNNFLTALTPFFFYSIGGYLVIQGSLTLGALVAVLAAYKDFSAPLRELFRFYQSFEDVRIRYAGVLAYLSGQPANDLLEDHDVTLSAARPLAGLQMAESKT